MSGTFWDTVVICLITGLMLVTSLLANPDLAAIYNNTMLASNDLSIDTAVGIFSGGAALATACFESIPVLGPLVLVVGLLCFTYSTMLGWSQYGDRAITYLFGTKGIRPYQWWRLGLEPLRYFECPYGCPELYSGLGSFWRDCQGNKVLDL